MWKKMAKAHAERPHERHRIIGGRRSHMRMSRALCDVCYFTGATRSGCGRCGGFFFYVFNLLQLGWCKQGDVCAA